MKSLFTRTISAALVAGMLFLGSGCMTHQHVVGSGGTGQTEEARQWYILWGLVPLNEVDTNDMAGGASNYTIETEITPLDFVINIFTSFVTVYSRTVTVTQ